MASTVGRGRGRGRGLYTVPQRRPGEQTSDQNSADVLEEKPTSVKSGLDDLKKVIGDFRLRDNTSTDLLIHEARKYVSNEGNLNEIVDYICGKTFEEPEFANVAAKIGEILCGVQFQGGLSFRTSLLRKTQGYFKDRQSFHERSLKEWIALVSFICQLFNVLRINDQPMKPLAVPIYQMLNELLKGRQFDEISCFHKQLKDTGLLLDTTDKEKMDDLFMKMRILLVDTESPEYTRVLLLELIELRSGNWKMSKDNLQFYEESRKELLGNAHII